MAAIFSKLLTKTDVDNYLSIHSSPLGQQLSFQLGQTVDMHVGDDNGRQWTFSCSITGLDDDQNSLLARHFLAVEWHEFAREKNVRVGDQVIIYEDFIKRKNEPSGTSNGMKIQVQRKIRLFGVDIWATVQ